MQLWKKETKRCAKPQKTNLTKVVSVGVRGAIYLFSSSFSGRQSSPCRTPFCCKSGDSSHCSTPACRRDLWQSLLYWKLSPSLTISSWGSEGHFFKSELPFVRLIPKVSAVSDLIRTLLCGDSSSFRLFFWPYIGIQLFCAWNQRALWVWGAEL